MTPTKKGLARAIARAAEMRAEGSSWAAVGRQLHRHPDTVRHWPKTYPEVWRDAYADAATEVASETGAEAVFVLRELMRSTDEKIRRDAAKLLLHLRLEARPPQAKTAPVPTAKQSDAQRIAAELEKIDDDALDAYVAGLLDEVRAVVDRQPDEAVAPEARPD